MNVIETLIKNGAGIRALSWKEPYASLMLVGKIETRTWYTKYRGLVLICCSQKPYNWVSVNEISGVEEFNRIVLAINKRKAIHSGRLDGKAIAIGLLADCRHMHPNDAEACYVKYHQDLWCHVYTIVKPIVPFEWKGSRKWGKVGEDIISSIEFLA